MRNCKYLSQNPLDKSCFDGDEQGICVLQQTKIITLSLANQVFLFQFGKHGDLRRPEAGPPFSGNTSKNEFWKGILE